MKWAIEKQTINGIDYLSGWRLDPKNGTVDTQPPHDLLDANGKLQHVLNADGTTTKQQQALTADELEVKRQQGVVHGIRKKYTVDEEFSILRRKIEGASDRWDEYAAYVQSVIDETLSADGSATKA